MTNQMSEQPWFAETLRPPLQVATVLLTDIGRNGMLRLYAATRLKPPEQGCLTFPGGRLFNEAETPLNAAARELFEETALSCSQTDLTSMSPPITIMTGDQQLITFHVFTVPRHKCIGGFPKEQIPYHGPWQALTLDEIAQLPGDKVVREIVMRFFSVPSHILEGCLLHQLGYTQ